MSFLRDLAEIENHFFELDETKRLAHIYLRFDAASDLFDVNYLTKRPIMSDDFLDWLNSAFQMVPASYQIELNIEIGDLENYTEEELQNIFHDNILLEHKTKRQESRRKKKLAFILIFVGIVFFVMMVAVGNVWPEEGIFHDIFFYMSDIAATVTIWEALGILLVEERETRLYLRNLSSRFSSINFIHPEADASS